MDKMKGAGSSGFKCHWTNLCAGSFLTVATTIAFGALGWRATSSWKMPMIQARAIQLLSGAGGTATGILSAKLLGLSARLQTAESTTRNTPPSIPPPSADSKTTAQAAPSALTSRASSAPPNQSSLVRPITLTDAASGEPTATPPIKLFAAASIRPFIAPPRTLPKPLETIETLAPLRPSITSSASAAATPFPTIFDPPSKVLAKQLSPPTKLQLPPELPPVLLAEPATSLLASPTETLEKGALQSKEVAMQFNGGSSAMVKQPDAPPTNPPSRPMRPPPSPPIPKPAGAASSLPGKVQPLANPMEPPTIISVSLPLKTSSNTPPATTTPSANRSRKDTLFQRLKLGQAKKHKKEEAVEKELPPQRALISKTLNLSSELRDCDYEESCQQYALIAKDRAHLDSVTELVIDDFALRAFIEKKKEGNSNWHGLISLAKDVTSLHLTLSPKVQAMDVEYFRHTVLLPLILSMPSMRLTKLSLELPTSTTTEHLSALVKRLPPTLNMLTLALGSTATPEHLKVLKAESPAELNITVTIKHEQGMPILSGQDKVPFFSVVFDRKGFNVKFQ